VILRANTEYVEWDEDELTIVLKDHSLLFDRDVQLNTYQGTGGYEGTESIKGNIKPLVFGFVEYGEPVLLNPDTELYQFHDGPSHTGIIIYEGGRIRPNIVVNSSILNWLPTTADVNSGIIRIDYQQGIFRLAAPSAGQITFTKFGDTSVPRESTLSDIVLALIRRTAPELQIDSDSFGFHKAILGQPYGLYLREATTLGNVLTELAAPGGDVVSLTRLNQVRINHMSRTAARAFIDDRSIAVGSKIRRREPPRPGHTYKLGYQKVWKLLTENELLGDADQRTRHLMKAEFRWNEFVVEQRHSPSPKRFDSAKATELKSYMIGPANHLVVEFALRDYMHRDLYEITVVGFAFMFNIGDTVLLQLTRWNMTVPRSMLVVEIADLSPTVGTEDETKLLLWG
jgi:hypothetical protein